MSIERPRRRRRRTAATTVSVALASSALAVLAPSTGRAMPTCGDPVMQVASGPDLEALIVCFNGSGSVAITIQLTRDVTIGDQLTAISNTAPGARVVIDGAGFTAFAAHDGSTLRVDADTVVDIVDLTLTRTGHRDPVRANQGRAVKNAGTTTLTGVTVRANDHGGIFYVNSEDLLGGGGVHNSGQMTISSSLIADNTGLRGGGIENQGELTLVGSVIEDNRLYDVSCGNGIFNDADLAVIRSTLTDQLCNGSVQYSDPTTAVGATTATVTESQLAGVINDGKMTLDRSTVSLPTDPAQRHRAGIGVVSSGRTTVTNSTISGFQTGFAATKSYLDGSSISHSTITDNDVGVDVSVDLNGNFVGGDPLRIAASIVSGNRSQIEQIGADVLGGFPSDRTDRVIDIASDGSNVIGDVTTRRNLDPGWFELDRSDVRSADPVLGPLRDNGGPTVTTRPRSGSPAIDLVDDTLVTVDQRGVSRPAGVRSDAGAVEVGSPTFASARPARLADTRAGGTTIDGTGAATGIVTPEEAMAVPVAGRAGVPDDATGAIVNLTAAQADRVGFASTTACDAEPPTTSSVNYRPGPPISNEIIVPLTGPGEFCVVVSSDVHIIVDLVGFVTEESQFVSASALRLADSRGQATVDGGFAPRARRIGGLVWRIGVAGRGSIPEDADAVRANVTITGASAPGFATVYDCDGSAPLASSINFDTGLPIANEITARLSDDGELCVMTSVDAHVIIDASGWTLDGVDTYEPRRPERVTDTRPFGETIDGIAAGSGRLQAGRPVEIVVTGRGTPALLDPIDSVLANMTIVGADRPGYATAYDCSDDPPFVGNLTFATSPRANEIVVGLSPTGTFCVVTSVDAHLVVDIVGTTSIDG